MESFIKFVKIINSTKTVDRFLTLQLESPKNESKIKKGDVFCLVEILTPNSSSSPIGNRVINTFINSYYKSSNASDSVNFELTIKNVNETLGRITRNGITNWIGNLNAILAVINENKLYLTQAGKAEAYLFRESKISHITDDFNANIEPHPLKTFSNIISGELKNGDKIIFASPVLFDYISIERLRQIITSGGIYTASENIAEILRKEKTNKVNALIMEINSKEEFASRIVEDEKEIIYIDKTNMLSFWSTFKKYIKSLKPTIDKIGNSTSKTYHSTIKFSQEKIIPQTKEMWSKLKDSSKKNFENIKNNIPNNKNDITKESLKKINKKQSNIQTPKELKSQNLYKIHHYNNKSKNKEIISQFSNKIGGLFQKISEYFQKIISYLTDKKHKSILYIILIVLLSIILMFSINSLRKKRQEQEIIENKKQELMKARSRFEDEAKLAILYNDNQKALSILTEVISTAEKLNDIPELAEDANELLNESQQKLDQLTNTVRLTDKNEVASFSDVNQFTIVNNVIFAINNNGNSIECKDKKIEIPPSSGTTRLLTYLGDEKNILLYTSENEMYKTTKEYSELEKIYPLKGKWSEANDMVTFFGSIYILDKNKNNIVKFHKTDEGYEQGINYIKDGTSITDVTSFAIDSKVYLLKQDGQIVALNRGKKINFDISGIPQPAPTIANPKNIYTDIEATSIWVQDGNRIIEFDKTGNFIKQYVFTELNNISDFKIDYKNKKFWILNLNKVYEINY